MATAVIDVLVVGAGPAGSAAAREAARAGATVLLVEARTRIGTPVRCAELVPAALVREGLLPRQALVQPVAGMRTFFAGGEVRTAAPGWMVDRERLDRSLAEAACAAGATLQTGTRVTGLRRQGAVYQVSALQGGSPVTLIARSVVGADGATGLAARWLGNPRLPALPGVGRRVENRGVGPDSLIFLRGRYRGGYGWLFPRGEEANLGVATWDDPKGALEALHRELIRQGLVGESRSRTGLSGAIPVAGLASQLAAEGIFLAGDAGGLAHPITGAGIWSALVTGRWAGEQAASWACGEERSPTRYEQRVRQSFGGSWQRAAERRREADLLDPGRFDARARRYWVAFPEYFEREEEGVESRWRVQST